jgi:hypothetical protein
MPIPRNEEAKRAQRVLNNPHISLSSGEIERLQSLVFCYSQQINMDRSDMKAAKRTLATVERRAEKALHKRAMYPKGGRNNADSRKS